MRNSPAFQLYARDALADAGLLLMEDSEWRCYWELCFFCWENDGLPVETEKLARLVRRPLAEFERIWREIGSKFEVRELADERRIYYHPRLWAQRESQRDKRQQTQDAAKARWEKQGKGGKGDRGCEDGKDKVDVIDLGDGDGEGWPTDESVDAGPVDAAVVELAHANASAKGHAKPKASAHANAHAKGMLRERARAAEAKAEAEAVEVGREQKQKGGRGPGGTMRTASGGAHAAADRPVAGAGGSGPSVPGKPPAGGYLAQAFKATGGGEMLENPEKPASTAGAISSALPGRGQDRRSDRVLEPALTQMAAEAKSGRKDDGSVTEWPPKGRRVGIPIAPAVWAAALDTMRERLDPDTFETWIRPLVPLSASRERAWLGCPGKIFRATVLRNYCSVLVESLLIAGGGEIDAEFEIELVILPGSTWEGSQLNSTEGPLAEEANAGVQLGEPAGTAPGSSRVGLSADPQPAQARTGA